MSHAVVVGGGIIGLNCAYYLRKEGHDVTILDDSSFWNNCSFGNMGYLSPSHFVPLTTPGILKQAFLWMLNSSSPFYIQPRLNWELIHWGLKFIQSARHDLLNTNIPHLQKLLVDSAALTAQMSDDLGGGFDLTHQGCLMLCKSEATVKHEIENVKLAESFGMNAEWCSANDLEKMEPGLGLDCKGGAWFHDDAHLHPAKWARILVDWLRKGSVKFVESKLIGFETRGSKVHAAICQDKHIPLDHIIIANGSRMPELIRKLNQHCFIVPGKGYSFEYEDLNLNLRYPSILVDHRVATTPLGSWLRIGGTMEISGHQPVVRMNRARAIYKAFKSYYTGMEINEPQASKVWYGFRPVSHDGMPYISPCTSFKNAYAAGGHGMLGVSLASVTGKIIADLISGYCNRELHPFRLNR